jgi:hypothetical protein
LIERDGGARFILSTKGNKSVFIRYLTFATVVGVACNVHAQTWNSRPNVLGQPEFGTTTTNGFGQQWHSQMNVTGHPEMGSTTTSSTGTVCSTMQNVTGHPEYGITTRCRQR